MSFQISIHAEKHFNDFTTCPEVGIFIVAYQKLLSVNYYHMNVLDNREMKKCRQNTHLHNELFKLVIFSSYQFL